MAKNKKSLGTKDFKDGVCFVLEEMFLTGFESQDAAVDLLKHVLWNYLNEIKKTMKKNNPDIFKNTILPVLEEENL